MAIHIMNSGLKVVTNYWRKPGPTDKFDWSASFDDHEPDDNGNMMVGYGATEEDAIDDLLDQYEDQQECEAESEEINHQALRFDHQQDLRKNWRE